jgi:hypothetical protein
MMTALMTGRGAMEIMWKREKVTRRVLETLRRMIIAALKLTWTLLTTLFTGKDKTNCGNVKSSTHIRSRWQYILTKLPEVIGQTESQYALRHTERSYTGEVLDSIFQHITRYIFIIQPNFSHASDVKQTKLR